MSHSNHSKVAILIPLSLLFCLPPLAAGWSDPNVAPLAEELLAKAAGRLTKEGDAKQQTCVVMDFIEDDGVQTRIGVEMADDFSASMSSFAPQLAVLNRAEHAESLESARLNTPFEHREATAAKYARSVGADLVVIGQILKEKNDLYVRIRMLNAEGESIAELHRILKTTAYFALGRDKLPPRPKLPFPYWPDVPVAGHKGFEEPKCVSCPTPAYSEAARKARTQGVMLVYLLIDTEGGVRDKVIAEGLPGGLAEKGVEAIERWRFEPVHGPDGKPATIQVAIEVNFRLL